ncbi:MAG: DUF2905 domain-containing protein [Methylococcales bacterium]
MELGKVLIVLGGVIISLGLVLTFAPWLINWFGKLPGDIRIENKNSLIFIPITSMIIISLLISLVLKLFFYK